MKNDPQELANQYFANLAKNTQSPTVLSGRYEKDSAKEAFVWEDILDKLECRELKPKTKILDVGCGAGFLVKKWLNHAKKNEAILYLNDIPEIIERLQSETLIGKKDPLLQFIQGVFPGSVKEHIPLEKFDLIVLYSVIHYSADPESLIDGAANLLNPGGHLLVGDIPNSNKKGRFLASKFGRQFDADYKGIPLSDVPLYNDQYDFVNRNKDIHPLLNDSFLVEIVKKYRHRGWEANVVPQPKTLPLSYTREDVVIYRND